MLYAVGAQWLEQRIIEALQSVLLVQGKQEITSRLFFIGAMSIDGNKVLCYLARGLGEQKWFVDAEIQLRMRSGAGPGIVLCGKDPGWKCIAVDIIATLATAPDGSATFAGPDRSFVETFFRSNSVSRSAALPSHSSKTPIEHHEPFDVPGEPELPLFSEQQLRRFRLLVDAKTKGLPGVKIRNLIAGSKYTGIQQMLGKAPAGLPGYLNDLGPSWWALKTN